MKSRSQPPSDRPRAARLFPFLFVTVWVIAGALLKWDAAWLYVALVLAVFAALGLSRQRSVALRCLLLVALIIPAMTRDGRWFGRVAPHPNTSTTPIATTNTEVGTNDATVISALVTDEETQLTLSPKMAVLSKGLLNLRLPSLGVEGIFAPSASVIDLGPALAEPVTDTLESRSWPVEKQAKVGAVDLWRPLLDAVSWFDHARVYIMSGEHPNGNTSLYESGGGFEALARMKSGEWRSLHGRMRLSWHRQSAASGELGEWQITSWKTERLDWIAGSRRWFTESSGTALRRPEDLQRARRSGHYAATVKYYREGMKQPPHPYFAPISVNQKEGIAIADVDGDGFDDIYVAVRIGNNMLFRNRGDGTFTEEAASRGLNLPGHTTCAIFADFDNDGDLDAMLGRSLLKTTYLENREGRFHQHPIPSHMPMAVISMAAADYNGDGLLDIYLCTYRPAAPVGASPAGGVAQGKEGDFDWPDEFFPPEGAREFRRRLAEHNQRKGGTVLDQIGPPNLLLINRGGGKFEPAPENLTVGIWRNSLQATWGDYDQDGDPDLFVANDWAPSNLFRNDGSAGFKEVTTEAGTTSYGFSMGASWGDYDNDGLDDVYVSNMYSDAGRRMTARIPGLSQMFVESAAGNWLYRQSAKGTFQQVAGLEPPAMTVMNAGWSWGGCFADFDNDRFLDLYVLSGYFTAPKEVASELDLESNLWRTMVRTDENLSRTTFRFSPEWKRTRGPDNPGPQIDARLAGVERQGDTILVHSLNGNERNHYFANVGGRSFVDISGLSGLDNPADSRGFAVLDYDRDGWQDVALVNANEPLFNLYHNDMPTAGRRGGMIAIRFVGGSRSPSPVQGLACRDGYGARVTVDLGDGKLVREHRCGDGWSTQNSATMIVGVGAHATVSSLAVRWPSGKTASTSAIPEGTLLTAYENPADSPTGEPFTRQTYRVKQVTQLPPVSERPVFPVTTLDAKSKPARLRLYTTFTTSSVSFKKHLPFLKQLKDELGPEGVDIVAVPIDEGDDNQKLAVYAKEWKPASRLVNIPPALRTNAVAAYIKVFGREPPLPATVITDQAGRILSALPGIPSISEVRKLAPEESAKN